jgi:hypothetical protein
MNKLESYKKALEEISDMQTPNGPIDSRLRAFYRIRDIAVEVMTGRCQKCLGSGYNGQCIYSGKCIACDGTGKSKRFVEEGKK